MNSDDLTAAYTKGDRVQYMLPGPEQGRAFTLLRLAGRKVVTELGAAVNPEANMADWWLTKEGKWVHPLWIRKLE